VRGFVRVDHELNGTLLAADEPAPVISLNLLYRSPFLLIGDHAGNIVPRALDGLGIGTEERARHIGWDIGIARLGELLSERLRAPFIRQVYSRLVIDCNRDPDRDDAIPPVSDGTVIPGNEALSAADLAARVAAIHAPYQQAITDALAERDAAGQATVLVALHSFTPVMAGVARPWAIGVLHDGHADGFARRLLAGLQGRGDLVVGDNEPYRMDGTDHSVPRHAFAAGLAYAELEIRQDLLAADPDGWASVLAAELIAALG
jgi:predicted N-formylglutamate amidohydrolase